MAGGPRRTNKVSFDQLSAAERRSRAVLSARHCVREASLSERHRDNGDRCFGAPSVPAPRLARVAESPCLARRI